MAGIRASGRSARPSQSSIRGNQSSPGPLPATGVAAAVRLRATCRVGRLLSRALLSTLMIVAVGCGGGPRAIDASVDEFDWRHAWELDPGFTMEIDADGYQLRSAIAFVPEPGPRPEDPLYYVTELRGTGAIGRSPPDPSPPRRPERGRASIPAFLMTSCCVDWPRSRSRLRSRCGVGGHLPLRPGG
jgi:hypothetical protein